MRAPQPLHPLPLPRTDPAAQQHRRHLVAGRDLDRRRIERLRTLAAERIGTRIDIDEDILASAARKLLGHRGPARLAPCISERLRCAAAMAMLLDDPQWRADSRVQALCRTIVDYIRAGDGVFEGVDSPALRHFDDAILVDAGWDTTAGEVVVYCDYRRLRQIEAELRGMSWAGFHFDRRDYEDARQAERELFRSARRIGLGRYVASAEWRSGPLIH
ncbi:hypothetical protein [Alkalisalibacterium limincola]|uniref:Uncharacterized protein n=1 Tax=Alkalisalibacterium limincola TaxID=2699169 RepID=A0A5C8KPP9_9GAMM|nr:hypothetical protein [Alkalisalibacterium limincola]TXK62164.1 hypothetical protein FU658_10075 [Alkalisalibacterium limincola]